MPPLHQCHQRFILAFVLLGRLHLWSQPDGLYNLRKVLKDDLQNVHVSCSNRHGIQPRKTSFKTCKICSARSLHCSCKKRALILHAFKNLTLKMSLFLQESWKPCKIYFPGSLQSRVFLELCSRHMKVGTVMLCSPLLKPVWLIRMMIWHFKSYFSNILSLIHLLVRPPRLLL